MEKINKQLIAQVRKRESWEDSYAPDELLQNSYLANPDNVREELAISLYDTLKEVLSIEEKELNYLIKEILDKEKLFSEESISRLSISQREKLVSVFPYLVADKTNIYGPNIEQAIQVVFREEILGIDRETKEN